MPEIRLDVADYGGPTVREGPGAPYALPRWEMRAWVQPGGETPLRQAVVDTGAPIGMMAQRIWQRLDSAGWIEWVSHAPGAQDDRGLMPRLAASGGNCPHRLGPVLASPSELSG